MDVVLNTLALKHRVLTKRRMSNVNIMKILKTTENNVSGHLSRFGWCEIIKDLNMAEWKPIELNIISAYKEYKNTNIISPTNFKSLRLIQIIINKSLTKNRKRKRLLEQCWEYI